jgi:N-acetylglucosaminyldiphosphoundecaprenol N-acetyl-beta-D-mannosaminyltransferase
LNSFDKIQTIKRIHIGKAPIDIIGADEAAHWVLNRLYHKVRTCVAPVNSAIVVASENQPQYVEVLESFDLLITDGLWPALSASLLYGARVPHTNTSPFLRALFRQSGPDGLKVFLLGARSEVVADAAANLARFHPNAKVIGYENGYFNHEDETKIVDLINKSGATTLLIGISSPKKELFINRHWDNLNLLLSVGVGGQFDIWGGITREAPDWVRKCGFEWLFRLMQEPKRLLKRYTADNIRFLFIVFKQAMNMLANRHKYYR